MAEKLSELMEKLRSWTNEPKRVHEAALRAEDRQREREAAAKTAGEYSAVGSAAGKTVDSPEQTVGNCGHCGRPVEYAYPRWQHQGFDLTLDEDHSAAPGS